MPVGITIDLLLNHTSEDSEWGFGRVRDNFTIEDVDVEKSNHFINLSAELEDQKPSIKPEQNDSIFKFEDIDTKTWFASAGSPAVSLLWGGPLSLASPQQQTIKEETPELDKECATDSGSQTPEPTSQHPVKLEIDTHFRDLAFKNEELEENKIPNTGPGGASNEIYKSEISSPILPVTSRRLYHRRKSWSCQVHQCQEVFTNKRLYERHLSKYHRFKSAECPLCGKTLGRKDYMADHIRSRRHRTALEAQKR